MVEPTDEAWWIERLDAPNDDDQDRITETVSHLRAHDKGTTRRRRGPSPHRSCDMRGAQNRGVSSTASCILRCVSGHETTPAQRLRRTVLTRPWRNCNPAGAPSRNASVYVLWPIERPNCRPVLVTSGLAPASVSATRAKVQCAKHRDTGEGDEAGADDRAGEHVHFLAANRATGTSSNGGLQASRPRSSPASRGERGTRPMRRPAARRHRAVCPTATVHAVAGDRRRLARRPTAGSREARTADGAVEQCIRGADEQSVRYAKGTKPKGTTTRRNSGADRPMMEIERRSTNRNLTIYFRGGRVVSKISARVSLDARARCS